MLSAAIKPKRGVMRHLEDNKDFRDTPQHMLTCVCAHTFYPITEKQLGDKQSDRERDGAREREGGKNGPERVTKQMNEM